MNNEASSPEARMTASREAGEIQSKYIQENGEAFLKKPRQYRTPLPLSAPKPLPDRKCRPSARW